MFAMASVRCHESNGTTGFAYLAQSHDHRRHGGIVELSEVVQSENQRAASVPQRFVRRGVRLRAKAGWRTRVDLDGVRHIHLV
jgi:hypothetical protein